MQAAPGLRAARRSHHVLLLLLNTTRNAPDPQAPFLWEPRVRDGFFQNL